MTGKRRGGRRSDSFVSQGATPAGGVPAPGITQALATMAAQLEAFASEVKDLKAILSEVATRSLSPSLNDTTLEVDLAHFRRLRKLRLFLCVALPLLFAACAALLLLKPRPLDSRPPQQNTAAVPNPIVVAPNRTIAVPRDAAPLATSGPSTAEKHAARPAAFRPSSRTSSMSVDKPAKAPASLDRHPSSSSALPERAARELSGGAPILD